MDLTYGYDRNGNVTAITDATSGARQSRSMGYDGLDRVTSVASNMFGSAWYTYDALDNLQQVSIGGTSARTHYYCYDTLTNRLEFVRSGPACVGTADPAVIALGYDAQGNVANKNGATYAFDFGNRLHTTAGLGYLYDAEGRRVKSSNAETQRIYSYYAKDGRLVWQRDEPNSKRISNVYLAGSLVAEYSRPIGSNVVTVAYQHTDALGSPIARTNSAGTVVETSEYEPYGKLLNRANDDRPGYTGHVMDSASGLAYMQQRYYDPQIGRFLSVDPVTAHSKGDSRYFNRYWYAAGNPYKFTDPDGRGFGLASKLVKLAFKGGDVAATVAGAVEDAKTLVSRDATLGQRAMAGGSLLTEVFSPVSARDVKAGINAIEGAADASKRLGTDAPLQRYQGPWTERDIARGMEGKGPLDMVPTRDAAGREMPLQLHHPDQLPGRGVHEVSPAEHRTPGLHPHPNRGVTDEILPKTGTEVVNSP